MRTVYTISCLIWKIAKWVWSAVVVTIVVGVATSLFAGKSSDFVNTAAVAVFKWFHTPGFLQGLTLAVIALYILITLASGLISVLFRTRYETKPTYDPPAEIKAMLSYLDSDIKAREEKEAAQKNRDATAQTRYLRTTMEANQSITPKGFATLSQAVIFADVPLEATFVQLQTVSDRPVFDAPYEQLRQLELVRQRTDLSDEMRDTYMQRSRIAWHSQLGPKRNVTPQIVPVNEVLLRLTPAHPVAVILGTPGSGKSTLLRWLTLHMARASFSQNYALPAGFSPAQVPLLIHLRDYAESLGKESLSMKQFIAAQASKIDPNAPTKLLDELARGHCFVLFDGLDEITTAHARGYVTDALYEFIADYSGEESGTHRYNRFLVTSRVAGYEPRALAKYAHYTLLDFDKQQTEQFLTNWCTATECYLTMSARGMQDLTQVEKEAANQAGIEHRDRLMQMLTNNLALRQLAINPLILTIMAVLHASGRIFPYQRMELYHMVVHTLLTTWNQESGRTMFSDEEIPLAELLLGNIAYCLHNGPPVLSAHDLHLLTRETMVAFNQRQANEIKEGDIRLFIETLRRSSGLLVEIGENIFCLARLAFQDYFVAQYLLRKPQEELKQFVLDHYHQATWREPLLLVIAHKSTDGSPSEQQEVNDLLQTILNTGSSNQDALQGNLVFVIDCLANCVPWWIDSKLHQHIANRLFTFCGDTLASGRFKHFPQELKASTTAWLRTQAQGQDDQGNILPLLWAWRMALCDDTHPACQEGATYLLGELASDLPLIPTVILDGLCAPLLQLAGASGFPYPAERVVDFPRPVARAATKEVKGYAHTALLNLSKRSLPGQVYVSWLLAKKQQAMPSQQSSVAPTPEQSQPAKQTEPGPNTLSL